MAVAGCNNAFRDAIQVFAEPAVQHNTSAADADHIRRQLTFITCALDGLVLGYPDPALRDRVHEAYDRKVEQAKQERGQ